MTTSSTTTSSPSNETSKQKTTKTNGSVFVSMLEQAVRLIDEGRSPSSVCDALGSSLAHSFRNMDGENRTQTSDFLKTVPNTAKIFGYYLQQEIDCIDDSREDAIRMLRNSRYPKLSEQVPQEISDDVRKEIKNLEEKNENVKRGMAEGKRDMYKDSFR